MRDVLAENIKKTILGPLHGNDEILSFGPLNLYTTGILYPQSEDSYLIDTQSQSVDDEDYIDNIDNDEEVDKSSRDSIYKNKESDDDDNYDQNEDELKLATNFSPSSMGFSFLVKEKTKFLLRYSLGQYKKKKIKKNDKEIYVWERNHIEDELECSITGNNLLVYEVERKELDIINEENFGCKLNFYCRNLDNKSELKLITISLINTIHEKKDDRNCIFQPELIVTTKEPVFHFFPDKTDFNNLLDDDEELNTALLYRDYFTYAMGHGVSVSWSKKDENSLVNEIQTQVMPEEIVHGVDVDRNDVIKDPHILEMKYLSGSSLNKDNFNHEQLIKDLYDFIKLYEDWISKQTTELNTLKIHKALITKGEKNLNVCRNLCSRFKKGVELINTNENVRQAFYDANEAMFIQRVLGSFSTWRREKRNVVPRTEGYSDSYLPNFKDLPSEGQKEDENNFGFFAKWRPFQIAFILSQIEGIVNPFSKDRDTTDLIWFPTGGGKTEAYLGLIAFTLFYRRLIKKDPDEGAGVSVMMRYTLRMLNLDQFQRANILISACDIIRSNNEEKYGKTKYSSGIWVGQSLTPNKYKDTDNAKKDGYNSNLETFIKNIEKGTSNKVKYSPFLINCPCCGNKLIKEKNGDQINGEWGYFRQYKNGDGLDNPTGNFLVSCTNKKCHFYTEKNNRSTNSIENNTFPFYTVDEEIFSQRPSLLFGTVDKYAQIAWKKECANLFNLDPENQNSRIFPGPDLIIQDELHLIGSSLGTIYGLFEYAIDKLCSFESVKPKIVGATATVKNAEEQCRRLYGRTNFIQFPPPGISADDSFFMKKNFEDKKPRKYIGFMPSGFTSSTSIIRLSSILIEAPNTLSYKNSELDKYYTLLIYFNSLKELGRFRTFIDDDIYAYRKFLDTTVLNKIHQNFSGRDIELSSAMNADDISTALEKLKKNILKNAIDNDTKLQLIQRKGIRSILDWKETTNKKFNLTKELFETLELEFSNDYKKNKEKFDEFLKSFYQLDKNNPIKIAIATNMIATGVDIGRLNVMLINGHPKSSSEYIQASSRVGREDSGLIYSFYSATKNRDRSHYENYKAFHQSFYKYVEPASVTPHSMPAMEKIIPSIIISLVWILYRKSENSLFKYDDQLDKYINEIKTEILERIGKNTEYYLDKIIEDIKNKWKSFNPPQRRFSNFHDYIKDPFSAISLGEVLDVPSHYSSLPVAQHLISKVSTMRDVEPSCTIKINYNE